MGRVAGKVRCFKSPTHSLTHHSDGLSPVAAVLRKYILCAPTYSCAGSGSMVRTSTGICTSSRYLLVIQLMRSRGNASKNCV
jgi:hypothetical protein